MIPVLLRCSSQVDDVVDLLDPRTLLFDGNRKIIGRAAKHVLPRCLDPRANRRILTYRLHIGGNLVAQIH